MNGKGGFAVFFYPQALEALGEAIKPYLQENGEVLDAGYSTITELRETEHLFLLHCGRQQWYFVNKAGFTKGTPDEFRAFISERIGG